MNHSKDDVLPSAAPIWVEILCNITSLDSSIFNPKKEHPCPVCGGTTRFRYRDKPAGLEAPFFCNNCGSRSGINLLMECTGMDFSEAINTVGDYLGQVPTEKLELIKRDFAIKASFSSWYKFNTETFEQIKTLSEAKINPWQRINGLTMIEMKSYQKQAVIPLLSKGNVVDCCLIDIDGNWETSAGNRMMQGGFYSEFGSGADDCAYFAISPLTAAKASVFMQRKVHCVWSQENLAGIGLDIKNPIAIVADLEETLEADSLMLPQLIFNKKTNKVSHQIYLPGEIVAMRDA